MQVETALADERHGLPESFDNASDQEIPAELYETGGLRRLGDDEGLLSDGIEKRDCRLDGRLLAGGEHIEIPGRSEFGAAEHGACHEALSDIGMSGGEPLCQPNADRAGGNMDGTGGEAIADAVLAEHDGLNSVVVCEHRKHRIAATGTRDRVRPLGASPH